jgi:hypothetical protein
MALGSSGDRPSVLIFSPGASGNRLAAQRRTALRIPDSGAPEKPRIFRQIFGDTC